MGRNKRKNAGEQTLLGLVLRCILLLVGPYAYLMLCGLVFDYLLKWYFMTDFIFYSLIVLWVAAIIWVIVLILRFVKAKRKGV